ncbi:MAG: hypothetical protein FWC06_04130 [Treponema sp.]|nr:hypothetical protein [Treponema sp.]
MNKKYKIILTVMLLFLIAIPLFGRDVIIIVRDADLSLPLEGAIIRTREGIEYICDVDGSAIIQAADGRQTIINASYPGYETGSLTIPIAGTLFTVDLHLLGILHGSELVIEATIPGTSDTRPGRSIAVTSRDIAQTGEIGIVEDVMSTIKLLPGVNYSGVFNAQPSIRGGHPGDMVASLDGYTINNPYFWNGVFSIFDPHMVQSAQLSHGVFSSRFGHTISGLLEVYSRKPSPTETLFELGINTSAAGFNISLPFQKGGILFMGRITYYDPVIALAKALSGAFPDLSVVNYINQAPYIRTASVTGNYRFTDDLEFATTMFWGMDGVGANYENSSRTAELNSDTSLAMDYTNYQGFLTSSLSWNPRADMLYKFLVGMGYEKTVINGGIKTNILEKSAADLFDKYPVLNNPAFFTSGSYSYNNYSLIDQSELSFNAQARIDFDWELSQRILFSAGIQELFNWKKSSGNQMVRQSDFFYNLSPEVRNEIISNFPAILLMANRDYLIINTPINYPPDTSNYLFNTSAYALAEYNAGNRLTGELGLRVDHFHLTGRDFSISSNPVLNPRLNLEYNLLMNQGIIQSLDLSLGTGLFSSVNDNVFLAEEQYGITKLKPNRSWTSVIGASFEFPDDLSLSIEGYYKYVYDRMYITTPTSANDVGLDVNPYFDGIGKIWGIDVMLHKTQSRYWDGWLSYSFNWAQYQDPNGRYGDLWYYPSFHRFHNLNLVANYRPVQNINIYMRFGIASGVPLARRSESGPQIYPVLVYDRDNPDNSYLIGQYSWLSVYDESNRTTLSLPMDIKFSYFGSNPSGKTRWEVYLAVENLLAFVYTAQGNTRYNQYTGQVETGNDSANFEIPIPIPSFGFRLSY